MTNHTHKCTYCNYLQSCDHTDCETSAFNTVVCDSSECNLRLQVDVLKSQLQNERADKSKLKDTFNRVRILGLGPSQMDAMVNDGTIDPHTIKLFVSRQKAFLVDCSVETVFCFMELYQKLAEMHAEFLHETSTKVNIRKDLIQKTEAKLKQAEKIRKGELNPDGSEPKPKERIKLNPYEKQVLNLMKLCKIDQASAEASVKSTGFPGEARDLKTLGYVN